MRKWLCIAPVLLLAGCSRTKTARGRDRRLRPTGAVASPTESAPPRSPVVIPSGTPLHVRVDESIDTRRNRAGDPFQRDAVRNPSRWKAGRWCRPGPSSPGTSLRPAASGRLKGRASLGLKLDAFRLNGREYPIQTTSVDRVSAAHKKRNAILIGGGTGLGAALGAIAGGPKGALIGAGAGAGAGTGGRCRHRQTPGRRFAAETPLRFTV